MLVESYSRTCWLDKLRPAGAPHRWKDLGPDGTCRGHWLIPLLKSLTTFLDSCMSFFRLSLLFFSVSFQAINSSNYVRHPCAGALLSSARADVGISLRRRFRRKSWNWQELRPMYRRDSSPGYSTRIPHVSPLAVVHHRASTIVPESCNSLLGFCKKKTTCHLRDHAAQKKRNTICALSVHAQSVDQVMQVSFIMWLSPQAPLHQGHVTLYILQL